MDDNIKIINLSSINVDKLATFNGNFSAVYHCTYNNQEFAYKEFLDSDYVKSKQEKISAFNKLKISGSLFPQYLVYDNLQKFEISGYLTEYCDSNISPILLLLDNNVELLSEIKNNIVNLHENGIIHGDLHFHNLLVTKDNKKVYIIDFDNSNYQKFKLDRDFVNLSASSYINHYGVNKGLDIFMFNMLTFCVLNKTNHYEDDIINHKYGAFGDTLEEKNICDSMLLNDKEYNGKYLIDAYQKKMKS